MRPHPRARGVRTCAQPGGPACLQASWQEEVPPEPLGCAVSWEAPRGLRTWWDQWGPDSVPQQGCSLGAEPQTRPVPRPSLGSFPPRRPCPTPGSISIPCVRLSVPPAHLSPGAHADPAVPTVTANPENGVLCFILSPRRGLALCLNCAPWTRWELRGPHGPHSRLSQDGRRRKIVLFF